MQTPIERLQARSNRSIFRPNLVDSKIDLLSNEIAQNDANLAAQMEAISRARQSQNQPTEDLTLDFDQTSSQLSGVQMPQSQGVVSPQSGSDQVATQSEVIAGDPRITQRFGQKSKYDVFSGGVNYGVDFAVKEGTPLALPPGQWQVVDSFSGAKGRGFIGNKTNKGYGNSVLVKNTQTGETLRFSHLKGVSVLPGKVYRGGTVLGTSGATGNVTGAHLDLEYRDSSGRIADVLRSKYASIL